MFKKLLVLLPIICLVVLVSFKVSQAASLSLSPSSGKINTIFSISGSGFNTDTTAITEWDGGFLTVSSTTIDGSGAYLATATVPSEATAGNHTIRVSSASVGQMPHSWWQHFFPRALAVYSSPGDYAEATFTVTTDTPQTPNSTPSSSSTNTGTSTPTSSSSSSTSSPSSSVQTISADSSSLSKNNSKLEVDKTSCPANGADKIIISLTLLDSQNRAITGLKPQITVSGSNNTLSAVEFRDNKYIATLSSTQIEEKTISAKISGIELNPLAVEFTDITFTAAASPTAANSTTNNSGKKSFWLVWWWWLLLLLLILILVYLYYRYRKARKDWKKSQQTEPKQ